MRGAGWGSKPIEVSKFKSRRTSTSRDMSTGGIGLGLSITQRAVLFHQGQVHAENANPGLRVSFELPLQTQGL
jgi:two-component system sensor histidine kinase CpxA